MNKISVTKYILMTEQVNFFSINTLRFSEHPIIHYSWTTKEEVKSYHFFHFSSYKRLKGKYQSRNNVFTNK